MTGNSNSNFNSDQASGSGKNKNTSIIVTGSFKSHGKQLLPKDMSASFVKKYGILVQPKFWGGEGCTDGVGVLSILRDSIPANIPLSDLADRETEAHPLFPAASSPQHPHPCWPGDASCPDLFATLPSCFVN